MKKFAIALAIVGLASTAAHAHAEKAKPAAKGAKVAAGKEGPKSLRKPANVECPADAAKVEEMIRKATSCFAAVQVATECAWGSNVDVSLAGAASEVCSKDFARMDGEDKKAFDHMNKRCNDKYAKAEGSLSRSMNAHCNLSVSEFWSRIYTPVEN